MTLPHLVIQGILAYLSLLVAAQSNLINPVEPTFTSIQPLETSQATVPTISASTVEIEVPSITIPSATSPTPVPGDDTFLLIGCFNEPPAISSTRALGATGSYLTPIFASQDALTVPLCLEACGVALAPNSTGPYTYAGVENSRECYCGLTLSLLSKPVTEGYCASPCAADSTTICGGYGYLSLYQRRSTLNSTNTTTISTPTASPTISPIASVSPSPKAKSHSKHSPGFWIGISLGIFFFLLLALALLWYSKRHRAASRALALSNAGLSTTNPSFVGGFALMHPSQKRNRPVNAVNTEDGRRFGIVVDDAATDAETYVSPMEGSPALKGIRNRPTFEEWKTGVVAPVRVPEDPAAIAKSVELDSTVSPGGQSDAGFGGSGGEQRGHETPIAELADSRLPVSIDSGERASVDIDGTREARPGPDEWELERRLKELGGLSPVSEPSGLTSRMSEADV
ncbi:hypothetical protein DL95DRAFT_400264 [Leptodontidium sp. 2 PMI_412]|nr:hypothetical protein DL95DRAFT_400264 [Leptodontidium sp. 2 PMI_412]